MPILKDWYLGFDVGNKEVQAPVLRLPNLFGNAYGHHSYYEGEQVKDEVLYVYDIERDAFVARNGTHWKLSVAHMNLEYKILFPHAREQLILSLTILEVIRQMAVDATT